MAGTPQWAKDYANGKLPQGAPPEKGGVREQFTVVRRTPAAGPQGRVAAPTGPAGPMPMPMAMSRMTGTGVDGQLQPSKMTGQVHEGEGVLNTNAMQNFTREEFQAFSQALESGKLNKDLLRQAIGMPAVQGYQLGGIAGKPLVDPISAFIGSTATPAETAAFKAKVAEKTGTSTTPAATSSTSATPQSIIAKPTYIDTSIKPISIAQPELPPPVLPPAVTFKPTVIPKKVIQPMSVIPPAQTAAPAAPANQIVTPSNAFDAQKAYENTLMTRQAASQAAGDAAAQQTLAQQGASTARTTNVMAELNRNQENAQDTLRTDLANQNVSNLTTFQNLDLNAKNQAKADKTQTESDITARINLLMAGGASTADIQADRELTALVKTKFGTTATPEQIASEITLRHTGISDASGNIFKTNAAKLIDDAIFAKTPLEVLVNDPATKRAVNGALGGNATPEEITASITAQYNEGKKTNVDRTFDTIVNDSGWITPAITAVVGWDDDLKQTIRDLTSKGFLNADGTPKDGAVIEWPWEDPDTYYKYNDWNGVPVAGGKYDQTKTITFDGNGTTYKNAAGTAVTMADANAMWNDPLTVSAAEKEAYFKNGAIDMTAFMNDHFRTTTGTNGETVKISTRGEYSKMVMDEKTGPAFVDAINASLKEWSSAEVYPGEVSADNTHAGESIGDDQYLYYDENNKAHVIGKEDPNLGYIYQQLSEKTGHPLTATQFGEMWKDGKPWRVSSDGTIKNLNTPNEEIPSTKREGVIQLATWNRADVQPLSKENIASLNAITEKDAIANTELFANGTTGVGNPFQKENGGYGDYGDPEYTGNYVLEEVDNYFAGDTLMSPFLNDWVDKNMGKPYRTKGGKVYQIVGKAYDDSSGQDKIFMRDINTNKILEYKNFGNSKEIGTATDKNFSALFTNLNNVIKKGS